MMNKTKKNFLLFGILLTCISVSSTGLNAQSINDTEEILGTEGDVENEKLQVKKELPNKLKTFTPTEVSTKDIFDPKNSSRFVRLRTVIEEGLRENPYEKLRRIKKKLATSELKDIKAKFWFPDVNLFIQTDDHRVGRLDRGSSYGNDPAHIASGSAGLSLGEYTLFNWGKDYLEYLNEKSLNQKTQRNLRELTRGLRHILIIRYFKLGVVKRFEEIQREKLQHASFIYRLTRERAPLKKVTQQEYFQARSEYLKARKEYQQAQIDTLNEDEQFAFLLGDHLNTTYKLKDELKVETLTIHFQDVIRTAINSNPDILDAKIGYDIQNRKYQRILKENLPR
jgi:outer membrane protein TolC